MVPGGGAQDDEVDSLKCKISNKVNIKIALANVVHW